uniref:Uncharacterized protein n=1 Tax=Rhodosorus marinus TaxID=101924 RepID=A0A7S2ZGW2_9RHOD|mmetsp:Transcript_18088/g.72381  ORF Transcript_18088/g.72381 Transcript_18088/m.72381 type:complete len:939 (+) Transcript_18088:313-3129(+)
MKKNGYGSNASDSSGTPKTKFQSFNANALLPKASHASPNVPQRGYGTGGGGMQMLGRSSGARANPAAPLPVNLPSIRRETTGSIGSASPGTWGSRPMGFSGSALAQSPPSNLSAKPSLDRPSVRTGLTGTSSPAAKDASGPAPAWGGKGIPTLANNEESISTPATAKPSVGPGPSAGDAPQGQGDPSFPSLGAKPLSAPAGAAKVESAPTVVRTTREAAGELSDWAEDPEETMNFSMPLELEFVTTKASEGAEREAATEGAKGAEVEAESEAHPETLQDTKGTQPSASNEGKGLRFVSAKKSSVTIPQAKPTLGGEGAEAQPSTNSESAGEPAPETAVVNKPATPQGHGLADGQREILRQKAEERRREEEERVRVQKERSMAKLKELEQRIFERSSQQPKALQDIAVQKTEHVNSGADSRTTGLSDPSEEGGRERSAVESSSNELVDESSQNKNTGSTPARWSEIDSTSVPTSQLESSGMVKSILTRPSKSTESTGLESTPDEASQKHLVVGGPEEAPVKVVVDEHEAAGRQSSSSPAKDHGEGSAPSSMENKPSSGSPKLQSSRRSDRQKDSTVNAPSSPRSHRNNERNVEAAPSMDPHHSPTVKRGRAGVHEGTHKGVLQKNRDRSAHKEEGTEGVVHMVLNSEDNVESSVTGRKKVQRDKLSKRIKLKKVNTPRGDDPQNREIGDSRAEAGQGPKVNEDSGGWQKVKKAPVTSKSNYDERRSSKGDRYGVVEKSKSASETPDAHEGVEDDAGSDGWKEVKARRPDRKKFNHPQSQQVGRKDRRQRSPVEGYQDIGRKPRDSRSGDTGSARVAKPVEPRQVEGGEKVPTTTEEKVWQMKQPGTASPLHSAEANVEAATASKPGASYHSVARNGQRPRSYVDSVQGVRPEASEPLISQRTTPKPNASQPAGTAEAYSNGEDHNQSARGGSNRNTVIK